MSIDIANRIRVFIDIKDCITILAMGSHDVIIIEKEEIKELIEALTEYSKEIK